MQYSRPMARRLFSLGALIAGILAMLGSWSCSAEIPSLSIGTFNNDVNALIFIALERGHLAANGLRVVLKIYPSGKTAIEGMLKGEVDIATASEYAFAGSVLEGENVRLVANINRSSVEYLVARADKGVGKISDLQGKRVGVPLGSRPEFALGRFLYLNGIDSTEVTLVDVPVDQSVNALVNEKVDAVAAWQPYIDQIEDYLGDRMIVWSVQSGQPSYNGLICTADWMVAHPDLIVRLLKSLVQAESYTLRQPKAAMGIITRKLNYSEAYEASVWANYQFSVSLDESLIIAMEDETRWMMSNNVAKKNPMPDFVDYIYEEALRKIRPEAVNIIR